MALRFEKTVIAVIAGVLLSPAIFAAQIFQYAATHRVSRITHMKKNGAPGTLTIDDHGISFSTPKQPHPWHWDYQDIQQLKVGPANLTILTYKSAKWRLDADRAFTFDLARGKTLDDACEFLKTRLDQRFVAAVAEPPASLLWQIPVKHRAGLGGDEGVLKIGAREITYESAKQGQSRTWRYEDIDNIASSGPFDLTITTFEHAKFSYGNRKQYSFELKQRLTESQFNRLWRRLNESQGLKVLSAYAGAVN